MSSFALGVDRLMGETALRKPLRGKRVAFLGHSASLSSGLEHTLDLLSQAPGIDLVSAFGPQHGMRGEKQDNMVESSDYFDPRVGVPVHSLYGKVRRPTAEMLGALDVLIVDLQDLGCRVYTFLTTLFHVLEDCAAAGKEVWVLDRPNPAGRLVEGSRLEPGSESFVGAAAIPMRHGLTLGEAARWFATEQRLDLELQVVEMSGYRPEAGPGFGWPVGLLPWVNPSPNASSLNMARCYSGTVLLEGTRISEGRGTTVPLEVMGAPAMDVGRILAWMNDVAPDWTAGCKLRPCAFQPMFHKHAGQVCEGFQIHASAPLYQAQSFRPYRLVALFLKAFRQIHPELELWTEPPYEYETERLPIDVINGGAKLREWVDAPEHRIDEFERSLQADERAWREARSDFLLY